MIKPQLFIKIVSALFLFLLTQSSFLLHKFHVNTGILYLSHWAISDSHCSESAIEDLQTSERFIETTSGKHPDRLFRILESMKNYQEICESEPPLEYDDCLDVDTSSLNYHELNQEMTGNSKWVLDSFWLDDSAMSFNEKIPVVLKWKSPDLEVLASISNNEVSRSRDPLGGDWCVWRENEYIIQVGKAINLVWNGGFEWNSLITSQIPQYYSTNQENINNLTPIIIDNNNLYPYKKANSIACIKSNDGSYFGFYQFFPVTNNQLIYLQGAKVFTDGGTSADVGGPWETSYGRIPDFAAKRIDTRGNWNKYAKLSIPPQDAYQFSFRLANSGKGGVACFDDVFVLNMPIPISLFLSDEE